MNPRPLFLSAFNIIAAAAIGGIWNGYIPAPTSVAAAGTNLTLSATSGLDLTGLVDRDHTKGVLSATWISSAAGGTTTLTYSTLTAGKWDTDSGSLFTLAITNRVGAMTVSDVFEFAGRARIALSSVDTGGSTITGLTNSFALPTP